MSMYSSNTYILIRNSSLFGSKVLQRKVISPGRGPQVLTFALATRQLNHWGSAKRISKSGVYWRKNWALKTSILFQRTSGSGSLLPRTLNTSGISRTMISSSVRVRTGSSLLNRMLPSRNRLRTWKTILFKLRQGRLKFFPSGLLTLTIPSSHLSPNIWVPGRIETTR